jgi:protoporphyrinogen oxidase
MRSKKYSYVFSFVQIIIFIRGHDAIIKTVSQACQEKAEGLIVGGNFKDGISFGDCIKNGFLYADKIGAYLMSKK